MSVAVEELDAYATNVSRLLVEQGLILESDEDGYKRFLRGW